MLKHFQTQFLQSVVDNRHDPELLNHIDPVGRLNQQQVIAVYQGDYRARMLEALQSNYETTWLLMGDDDFQQLAESYIQQHPSNLKNLTPYGEHFPIFLKEQSIDEEIVQMAIFEQSFWNFFNRPDREAIKITPEVLENGSFNLEQSLVFFSSKLHLYPLWQKRHGNQEDLELNQFQGQFFSVLYKKNNVVEVRDLSKKQYLALQIIKENRNFIQSTINIEQQSLDLSPEDWKNLFDILKYHGV